MFSVLEFMHHLMVAKSALPIYKISSYTPGYRKSIIHSVSLGGNQEFGG